MLVSSAVGHGYDNTPTPLYTPTPLWNVLLENVLKSEKNALESPNPSPYHPPPPLPPLIDFFRAGAKSIGSRTVARHFAPSANTLAPPLCRGHAFRRSVGDIKALQNNFAFIISTETCFCLKRLSDRTFFRLFRKAFLNPLIKIALRLSSATITLQVIWKPWYYARKVMINAPQETK